VGKGQSTSDGKLVKSSERILSSVRADMHAFYKKAEISACYLAHFLQEAFLL